MSEGRVHRARISGIAFLTGLAGLGSETVFFKLFDLTLGAAALAAFAVVASFVLGMGVGARVSARVARPFVAEVLVALYDVAWIVFFDPLRGVAGGIVAALAPSLGVNVVAAILCVALAFPPAVLLGVSFPAIAERSGEHVARPYALNAFGAAIGVVLVDALLYPVFGLYACLGLLAVVHAFAAALMFKLRFEAISGVGRQRAKFVAVLFFAGAATGGVQGVWLFLAQLLFQPFYFVQPAVVTTMIVGLVFGSVAWIRLRFSFERAVFAALCGIALSAIGVLIVLRIPQNESMATAVLAIAALLAPTAIPIGALVPAYFADRQVTREEVGAGWLSIAAGNALGILLTGGLLLANLSALWALALLATLLTAIAARREPWILFPLAALSATALAVDDADYIARLREHEGQTISIQHLYRGPAELSAIYTFLSPRTLKNQRRLYQTGFSPMYLDDSPEAWIGAVGASYTPGKDRALILGAGSGISAAAMTKLYAHCDVVDIGATVPALLEALGNLQDQPNVHYHPIDAVLAPYALKDHRYDLIVLTVDPAFHAKAAKLYTRELFEQLRAMLTRNGVFVFWADADLDAEASQVLINTGRAVFKNQKLYSAFAKPQGKSEISYYFLVHGDSDLSYRPDRVKKILTLPVVENTRLLEGRAHPTEELHSLVDPAPSVLFGGYHRGVVPLH